MLSSKVLCFLWNTYKTRFSPQIAPSSVLFKCYHRRFCVSCETPTKWDFSQQIEPSSVLFRLEVRACVLTTLWLESIKWIVWNFTIEGPVFLVKLLQRSLLKLAVWLATYITKVITVIISLFYQKIINISNNFCTPLHILQKYLAACAQDKVLVYKQRVKTSLLLSFLLMWRA